MDVQESYDSAASAYTEHLADELDHKPLDRHLLNRFAEQMSERGFVVDLGCGPGHISKYLRDRRVAMIGIDISPRMIDCARRLAPGIEFSVGDMRRLSYSASSLAGAVSFYSIVHFDADQLGAVMTEMRRVLIPDGLAFVSFHAGEGVVHRDELFGAPVNLDFRFHSVTSVIDSMTFAGFEVIEQTVREPYAGSEYPSRRCYLLAKAVSR